MRPVPKPLDFNRIEIELAQMAALVETNLADVIMAFERCAVTSAEEIIDADKRVDQFHHTIETGVYGLLEA
ncbi:MAG: PhoU domain-containing protein, partial [Pseudomonadota bacterium]